MSGWWKTRLGKQRGDQRDLMIKCSGSWIGFRNGKDISGIADEMWI